MDLSKYHGSTLVYNKHDWPKANIITSKEEANKLLKYGEKLGVRYLTKGGHIQKEGMLTKGYWLITDVSKGNYTTLEFMLAYGKLYRFVYRNGLPNDEEYTGLDALNELKRECATILKPFAVSTNEEVQAIKDTIPKLWIKLTDIGEMLRDQELENIVHIDINSAFPAGVVAKHPEFRPFFEKHYNLRKEDKIHKAIMNYAIGACQSTKIRGNRYPQLSKDGIEWTVNKLRDLSDKLKKKGYVVIGYNTDGIFYRKHPNQPLYTDKEEGLGLGQWKTDSVFDKIRFKSAGSYEYIKNGVYHPVVRGYTTLDKEMTRDKWQWGDIYKTRLLALQFKNNQLIEVEVEE